MSNRIKYTTSRTGEMRKHYLRQADVEVLLARLPEELYERLRAVHFNDQARGNRCLGYVTRGRREIAICALPQRVSLTRFLVKRPGRQRVRGAPQDFGAVRGVQWPETAVRRFLLYEVFLHELGHLQIVDPNAKEPRRRFASEGMAQVFANTMRKQLWSTPLDHPDPIHNRATEGEWEQAARQVALARDPIHAGPVWTAGD
jgi:hypothetical protein